MVMIPSDKIISTTDLVRNYKKVSLKIEEEDINFIFKNNKPYMVVMTCEYYKLLLDRTGVWKDKKGTVDKETP